MSNRMKAFARCAATMMAMAGAMTLASCGRFGKPEPVETGFVTHKFMSKATGKEREYGMTIPAKYNESKREWPLIIFLHGAGERGDDVQLVLKHGPLKEAMMRGDDFPFLVVGPQCPSQLSQDVRSTWSASMEDVLAILETVKKEYRVDDSRVYLTGLSLGGFGSFMIAAEHPELFAAVAPICGGGEAAKVSAYKDLPFWVFHGDADRVVPVARSTEMVDAMKALGQEPKYTIYPGVDHDSWTQTYSNDELYAWMLQHRRESN